MARRWDIPCQVQTVNVRAYAKSHRLGVEEAARDLRYQALAVLARRRRCAAIVTAHTADDQAETVLMNFLRGSGPAGLAGMAAARGSNAFPNLLIIRPFLGMKRDQIAAYLQRHLLTYRNDPSNHSMRFARNRIRRSTLPYLEKLFPGLAGRLAQTAEIFRDEEDFWQQRTQRELRKTARKNNQQITVVLPQLLRYHKVFSRRILRRLLPGLSFQDIEHLLILARSPQPTGCLNLSGSWCVTRRQNKLVAVRKRMG
jgi:tRNA(Ile)-lysidine synthase